MWEISTAGEQDGGDCRGEAHEMPPPGFPVNGECRPRASVQSGQETAAWPRAYIPCTRSLGSRGLGLARLAAGSGIRLFIALIWASLFVLASAPESALFPILRSDFCRVFCLGEKRVSFFQKHDYNNNNDNDDNKTWMFFENRRLRVFLQLIWRLIYTQVFTNWFTVLFLHTWMTWICFWIFLILDFSIL